MQSGTYLPNFTVSNTWSLWFLYWETALWLTIWPVVYTEQSLYTIDTKDYKHSLYIMSPVCWDGDCMSECVTEHDSCQRNQTKFAGRNLWSVMSQPGAKKKQKTVTIDCFSFNVMKDAMDWCLNITSRCHKMRTGQLPWTAVCSVQLSTPKWLWCTHTRTCARIRTYTFTLHAVFIDSKKFIT